MSENDTMPVTFEKARVNVWNIGGFVVAIVVTAFGWGVTYNTMTTNNTNAKDAIADVRDDIKNINSQLPQITQLQFQVTRVVEQLAETKSGVTAVNERVDRVVNSFGEKLDTISTNVNKVITRVEVLTNQMGTPPQRQTRLFTEKEITR